MNEQYPLALPLATNVNGYIINKIIGQGGFGITYLAYDTATDKTIALKEYFPTSIALRNNGATVTPQSVGGENDFAQGKFSFLKEAQTLGKFRHKAIAQVLGYFEANGTAYTVMEFVKGNTLAQRIKQLKAEGKTMSEKEIMTWLNSVMDGLAAVHSEQFLHRDIKPENTMLNPETGEGCLIDFGAARHDAGGKTKSLSVLLTPGFAPIEQYSSDGKGQGTWTDVYALGATLWCAMAGEAPKDAPARTTALMYDHPDPISVDKQKLIAKGYSANLVNTAMKMMALKSKERLKTIADVKESLAHQEPNVTEQPNENVRNNRSTGNEKVSSTQNRSSRKNNNWLKQLGTTNTTYTDKDEKAWHKQLGTTSATGVSKGSKENLSNQATEAQDTVLGSKKQIFLVIAILIAVVIVSICILPEKLNNLADYYYENNDFEQAVTYYQIAAKMGNADAMWSLGCCYAEGKGVPKDTIESAVWIEEAASHGNAAAIHFKNEVSKAFWKRYNKEQKAYWNRVYKDLYP